MKFIYCERCGKSIVRTGGRQLQCKQCRVISEKERKKKWQQDHKERVALKVKQWHWKNLEHSRKIKRETYYRKKNKKNLSAHS